MAGISPRIGSTALPAYLLLVGRLVVSAAFIMAALPKIQDPEAFAVSVEAFRIITGTFIMWTALALPWLELVIGFGLLIPQIRRGSALIIALLLIVFISLHASAWARGLDISCGCFSTHASDKAPEYLWLILRNVGLIAASVCVLIRDWQKPREGSLREAASTS